MSAWSIGFSPFLPWTALYALAAAALVVSVALVWRRRARRVAASAQPGAVAARPLRSQSSCRRTAGRSRTSSRWSSTVPAARTSASAPQQTDKARDEVEARLEGARRRRSARRRNVARANRKPRARKLFAALRGALADAPPERVGGADRDHRRRRARHSPVSGRARLQRAAARADHRPRGRARSGASNWSKRRATASSARTRRSSRASSTAPTAASR